MIKNLIVSCCLAIFSISTFADITSYKTRYGQFQVKASDAYPQGALYFNQKRVNPVIEGNESLSVEGVYKLNKDDVLLVQDNGGSGCPATLYFVKVSSSQKVSVSPAFGSCSDLIKVSAKEKQITVTMPDFIGDPENDAQEKAVAKRKMTYIFDGNFIKENGKILKREN